MPSRQPISPAQAREAHHAHRPTPSHNARENAHQRRKRDPRDRWTAPAGDAAQARHSPRESWTAPAPKHSPGDRHGATTEAQEPRPAAETIHQRRHARRALPAAEDQRPRHAAKLDTTSRTTTPRKRCKTPVEPPTPQALQRYQTRPGAAKRRRRSRHGVTHAGKARKDSGEPPTPSPDTDQPSRPTADPLPAHTSRHKRPPPQAEPPPETAETPTPTTAKL